MWIWRSLFGFSIKDASFSLQVHRVDLCSDFFLLWEISCVTGLRSYLKWRNWILTLRVALTYEKLEVKWVEDDAFHLTSARGWECVVEFICSLIDGFIDGWCGSSCSLSVLCGVLVMGWKCRTPTPALSSTLHGNRSQQLLVKLDCSQRWLVILQVQWKQSCRYGGENAQVLFLKEAVASTPVLLKCYIVLFIQKAV